MKNKELKNNKNRLLSGFTLIEVIVVMSIFLFIVGAAIGIFISVIQNQKKVLAEQQLINQVSYIEEYMSKALRMATADIQGSCIKKPQGAHEYFGHIYYLTRKDIVTNDFRGVKFLNQSTSQCQEFYLDDNGILQEAIWDVSDPENENPQSLSPITSSNLKIDKIRFAVDGFLGNISSNEICGENDACGSSNLIENQPRITMILEINIPGDTQNPKRTIQTTVSQRNLNIDNGQRLAQ